MLIWLVGVDKVNLSNDFCIFVKIWIQTPKTPKCSYILLNTVEVVTLCCHNWPFLCSFGYDLLTLCMLLPLWNLPRLQPAPLSPVFIYSFTQYFKGMTQLADKLFYHVALYNKTI